MICFVCSSGRVSNLSVIGLTHSQLIYLFIRMTTHVYNTILKSFVYICIILADWYESSVSIGSVEEYCIGMKFVCSISIEKCVWVWKGGHLQDFNNIIMQFCTYFISFEWVHSVVFLSAEGYQLLLNRNKLTQKVHNWEKWSQLC